MKRTTLIPIVTLIAIITTTLACSFQTSTTPSQAVDHDLQATANALSVQATVNTQMMSQQLTQAAQAAQQPEAEQVQATYTPYPTYTIPAPAEEQSIASTGEDFETLKQSAKILVIDNMRDKTGGSIIPDALTALGLQKNTTSHVSDVGNFLTDLRSGNKWDLIIVGTEAKERVKGELWEAILDQVVSKKAGVVTEFWYAWDIGGQGSKMGNFLATCGVEVHKDLEWSKDLYLYALIPEDGVFTEPNPMGMPSIRFTPYWSHNLGDDQGWEGDLLRKTAGSTAKILAGTQPNEYDRYGVVVRCFDGRVIIQSFSSHDYQLSGMTKLYQNYIYNALKSHYQATGQLAE